LNAVGAGCLQGSDAVAESGEVSWQYGGGDLDSSAHNADVNALTPLTSHVVARQQASLTAGERTELHADRIVAGGAAMGRGSDGRVMFVDGALPGETVIAEVVSSKKDFLKGRAVQIVSASPDRRDPPCRYVAAGCGGCSWQHIEPNAQHEFKRLIVVDALRRTAGLKQADVYLGPTLPSQRFRTTLRLGVGSSGAVGFRAARSNDVVPVDDCLVAHPAIAELLGELRFEPHPAVPRPFGRGERGVSPEVTVRIGARTGERMMWWRNTSLLDSVTIPADVRIGEDSSISEIVNGTKLRVSARSFFQSSPESAEAIIDAVADASGTFLTDDDGPILDLYGGVGLFAATVVPSQRRVVVVESSPSSCADARVNLAARDADVVESRVENWRCIEAQLVIADPSRPGLDKLGVAAVQQTGCRRLVLVSCDPVSLARDARLLGAAGYQHRGSLVLDPFPHTPHIEVVSRFDRV
jgi:23S rRNA (uracil1939-C5)-methyltransferase